MKPNFALDLSHEGIVLAHRSPRGTWTKVGDVKLEDPALRENLSFLRSTAVGLEGKGFGSKLILPNSQILYLNVSAPGPDDETRIAQIKAELEGKTPYEVRDLTFDWLETGGAVQVAVVAKETLDEAEEFAVEHRFNPISFTGRSSDDPDAWLPFFGRTDYSYAILDDKVDVRDTPHPVPAPLLAAGDSLFETDANAPSEDGVDQSVPPISADDENFFTEEPVAEPIANTGENIFSGDDAAAEQAPSFTSRRQAVGQAIDGLAAPSTGSRIEGVEPRFAIDASEIPDTSTSHEPVDTYDPAAADDYAEPPVADDALRASFREPRENNVENPRRGTVFGRYFSGLILTLKGLWAKVGPGLGRVVGIFLAFLIVVFKFAFNMIAKLFRKREKPQKPAEVKAAAPLARDENPGRQKAILRGIAAILFLGLLGLGYAFFPSGSQNSGRTDGENGAEIIYTTAPAERGVQSGNRARSRPSDIAAIITASNGGSETGLDLSLPIRAVRPAPRSVFEGATDPDESLPDTATPVTNLTEEELADLRAAGISAPTHEEMAEGRVGTDSEDLSLAEITALYETTGILQSLLPPPRPQNDEERDDIYVASPDRGLKANDAIILPDFNDGVADYPPARVMSPLSPDTIFTFGDNGLVVATTEGAVNPDGILVRLGKPKIRPPEKPETTQLVLPNPLAALKPKARPTDLKTGDDAIFVQGRLTLAQLRTKKPKVRPESEQSATAESDATPSELAVLTSFQPAKRPSDFEKTVEKTRVRIASTRLATGRLKDTGVSNGPILPTRANVAKTATIKNAINLSKINLIGVYGTPSKRKALLRLASGRLVRVKIGDRVDGGRVAAIGTASLSYVKSGRNRVLKIPQ